MKTLKPVMLAALTVLTLGVGTAMADGEAVPTQYQIDQFNQVVAKQAASAQAANARAAALNQMLGQFEASGNKISAVMSSGAVTNPVSGNSAVTSKASTFTTLFGHYDPNSKQYAPLQGGDGGGGR